MKKIFIPMLLLFSTVVQAQLNNSWINYNNTYYKFTLAQTGLCRINQSTLVNAGLGNIPAEQFQLWRNGQQVPIYTTIPTGVFGSNDYIEFLGKANDGLPDNTLYLNPANQMCDSFSLFTDTATYFLTVNATGANLRFNNTVNDIADNTLQPDAYFMRRVENPYKQIVNPGYFVNLGESIYSSAYDQGEGWTSNGVYECCPLYEQFNGLNVYTAGPTNSVSFYISAYGNSYDSRNFYVNISNQSVVSDTSMYALTPIVIQKNNLPLSILQSSYAQVTMGFHDTSNPHDSTFDNIVVATVALTYPATFNFNNQQNFYFQLAPSVNGNYLQITNFNNNGIAPVLYDLNTGNRYTGNISTPGMVQFALPASTDNPRKFMLVSEDASNITAINTLTTRNFINYGNPANQGDYIIISDPVLYNDGSGNNYVEKYRQYRSSLAGGSYYAITVPIEELNDQFAFGIKKHPAAIRDFIRFAQTWNVIPKYVFLIGRGMTTQDYRQNASSPAANKLDLVQSFGTPASDVLLVCPPGQNVPLVPIGRLPVINATELAGYYNKIIDYEQQQASTSPLISDKVWMKNFLHISGGADATEGAQFTGYLNNYAKIAEDTLMGATVSTFSKSSTDYIEQASASAITTLINGGLGFIGYFGHASANVFAFNLSAPSGYTNKDRYPFFNVSGCTAGNFYTFDSTRLATPANLTISEDWVLAPNSGAIGFEADTHFGIPYYLDQFNTSFYQEFSNGLYGNTVGNQLRKVLQTLNPLLTNEGFFLRLHMEEINLNGDPALKINNFALPDYAVDPTLIKINPSIISVADNNFTVNVGLVNLGRAVNDSVTVLVERKLPNGSLQVMYNQQRLILNTDSLSFTIPINPLTDKGTNQLIVNIDPDDKIAELSKVNNIVTVDFTIFEDELNPVYPYNYAIVNQQNITYSASTANALGGQRQYLMQVDTTALFNSSFEKQYSANGLGGVIQFTPSNITFTDSTVYYWRTAMVPLTATTPIIWNSFSFVYLPKSSTGFNQSHYYQHLNSSYTNMSLDSDRVFRFAKVNRNLVIQTGLYPYFTYDKIDEYLDDVELDYYGCNYNVLQAIVYDSTTLQPWKNYNTNGSGRFGSRPVCSTDTRDFFEFPYTDINDRKLFMSFLDSIPNGMYVSITNFGTTVNVPGIATANTTFINNWKADSTILGSGNTLYDKLKAIGFTQIDSFTQNLPFLYFYRKNFSNFTPLQSMGTSASAYISDTMSLVSRLDSGVITSPLFGPAKAWTSLHWYGKSVDPLPVDNVQIQVYGVMADGITKTLMATVSPATDTSLSFISASQYPYLQLAMLNKDTVYLTPNQLDYWRINADYVPEGAVAPNILYNMIDTSTQGQQIPFVLAFKNISPVAFDSLNVKFTIQNLTTNKTDTFAIPKGKALVSGDTLVVRDTINTTNYPGNNLLYVMVNPYNDQPEQYLFNNSITQNFYVSADKYDPLLDVTFDGVHILNEDLVSSKPKIVIKLTDENQFLSLSDTSLIQVQVLFPDPNGGTGTLVNYHFGDSMQFIPANLGSGQNTATVNLMGNFPTDGQYELIVSGQDVEGNPAGNLSYRVAFNVINKTMISNLFNYPNPFTTSTAFVFTLTGSQLPQNMRIQILTITGKVVKEITQAELGPLHVGDNITQYKWDGTDMYGQKLANGVYLYRVLTNLNGKSIDNYNGSVNYGSNTPAVITNQGLNQLSTNPSMSNLFIKGYGKMYLMR